MGSEMRKLGLMISLLVAIGVQSCDEKQNPTNPIPIAKKVKPAFEILATPKFNADSAYAFIAKQVSFGPRVPNTEAHRKCANWLELKLKEYGLETNVQEAQLKAYNGQTLTTFNIMGQINPSASNRLLFCAHWDSRPYADRDSEKRSTPIDGANDGASGVGVILEMARVLSVDSNLKDFGIDVVFFDAEDYGKPEGSMIGRSSDSWCLGSQYWAANIPIPNYKPRFGILLDMVGASNAVFPKEGISMYYAPHIVNRVWKIAGAMGHDGYFKSFKGNEITDDHRYLNAIANIPTIDVIHYEMGRNDFGSFHHTHKDNMDVIDRTTLQVVGDVMLQVVYQEAK
ncbi:MAG: M28 family peptidase [Salibacteraceae bacterium]